MYDGLLKNRLPAGVSFLVFAGDVALIAVAKDTILLGNALSEAADTARNWLLGVGLQLAIRKSEALVITNTRTYNDMTVHVGEQQILASKSIKYLGLQIDSKLKFTQHAKYTAIKAQKVVRNISRILPNISLATSRKRRLISSAVQSILLYGAPNWADRMSAKGKAELTKVQRKAAIRVASAFSTEATQVLADLPPIDLLATERRITYMGKWTNDVTNHRAKVRKP